jgi:6-phosphogluconate dehydrogenase
MKIGMVGLGRMGANMVERLRRKGHEAVGYARTSPSRDVSSLEELVAALDSPRIVWLMVPAGDPTEKTIEGLIGLLEKGDLIVDGGNSNFRESIRRGQMLAEKGIGFVDAGVSGGIWGLEEGYCLMLGGGDEHVEMLRPALEALTEEGGFAHVGPSGSGHFTKMVHNGIEYGLMQAFGEGYELLTRSELDIDVPKTIDVWRHGSVVRSWLLDLLARALQQDPRLESIEGYAEDSGEGRWTVQEAVTAGSAAPVISAALFARFVSRQDSSPTMKVVAALRHQFGGHDVRKT